MRIVIDLQGAQTESRYRGIGRYTMSLTKTIIKNKGEHEIILALNGLFPETIEAIRAEFDHLLSQENIRVWYAPGPVKECETGNNWRREVAERIREAFLASLNPDVVLISSLFEGFVDNAVTSVGAFTENVPTAVILYDLIPLLNTELYFENNPSYVEYYHRKVYYLKKADICLSISESAALEGQNVIASPSDKVINISTACDSIFKPLTFSKEEKLLFLNSLAINKPYILYSGSAETRKNLDRLIRAYASMPFELKEDCQLVFAGKVSEVSSSYLRQVARKAGIKREQLVITGYITDEQLVRLYNFCSLFVLPSLHEGFGLPALEAMNCGAVVIGSNTTSIPEVIGCNEALFNPESIDSICQKMQQVLTDESFRKILKEHAKTQTNKFSWDKTAISAIAQLERCAESFNKQKKIYTHEKAHERLLTGITSIKTNKKLIKHEVMSVADAIAQNEASSSGRQLLVDVSELSQRDAATGVQRVVKNYLKQLINNPPPGFKVEPVYATLESGYYYAKKFTLDFLDLTAEGVEDTPIKWQRGDIFFALDMQHHVQLKHRNFYRELKAGGVNVVFMIYDLLPIQLYSYFNDPGSKKNHEDLLTLAAEANGVICISKATADAFSDWINSNNINCSQGFFVDWVHMGADFNQAADNATLHADSSNLLDSLTDRSTFLSVGTIEPRKAQDQILSAFELLWEQGYDLNLVLVGKRGWKTEDFIEKLQSHQELNHRLFWLEGINDQYLNQVYAASSCLIAASINEGFGLPLIEAAYHKKPLIARDIPVFREAAGDSAYYFTGETGEILAVAIKDWLALFKNNCQPTTDTLTWQTWQQSAVILKEKLLSNYRRKQLFLDISELVQRDAKSGIQRVVRSLLKELIENPPDGYWVEPVYATEHKLGYYYARHFLKEMFDQKSITLDDEPIEVGHGDIFFGLDLCPSVQSKQRVFYSKLRIMGIPVYFMVYDLLAVSRPDWWASDENEQTTLKRYYEQWLEVVVENSGAVCISHATASDLQDYLQKNRPADETKPFEINVSHIGADFKNTKPSKGIPEKANELINKLKEKPSFLMVGTLESRKGHLQTLLAFEQLWHDGKDINLVIVGKKGWLIEDLLNKMQKHPELNKKLFWLEETSDEYLEIIYAATTCLIAASEGEGFGLPLVEAAQHKLPIIARDIPVFREVAGEHALYFNDSKQPEVLAEAIIKWFGLFKSDNHPKPDQMTWLTWQESAENLLRCLVAYSPKSDDNET